MSTKSKQILIFAAIVLVLALAAAVILFGRDGGGNYEKELAEAEKYYDACDYDNAIAIYNRIIADNYDCAEAYAGLADAYFSKDRGDKALEILQKGAEYTDNDEIILDKMDELFPDLSYAEASAEPEEASETTVTEVSEAETVSSVSESETEETTAETTEAAEPEAVVTTVPTTAATTAPTTAPTTTATTPPTTVPTTIRTTVTTTVATTRTAAAATETEELIFVNVPDFTLMTIDEAYSWCSKNNLTLKVIGSGDKPLSQSPAPGTSVEENSDIIVKCGE